MKMSFKRKSPVYAFILIVIFMTTLVGCAGKKAVVEKPTAKGFIWEATKNDKVVTLIGTMHPAPATHNLINEDIITAINNCDVLSLEADLSIPSSVEKFTKNQLLPDGETYDKYLPGDEIDKLMQIIKDSGLKVDTEAIKKYNSAGVGSLLSGISIIKSGFTNNSLEEELTNAAKRKSKTVSEVEGIDFQIDLFNKLYTWDYIKSIINNYKVEDVDKEVEMNKELFTNYVDGDLEKAEALEKTIDMKNKSPKEYQLLIYDRNNGMAEKIDSLEKEDKKHVVAVGYRHFIGEESVLKMLEAKGYEIKRVN